MRVGTKTCAAVTPRAPAESAPCSGRACVPTLRAPGSSPSCQALCPSRGSHETPRAPPRRPPRRAASSTHALRPSADLRSQCIRASAESSGLRRLHAWRELAQRQGAPSIPSRAPARARAAPARPSHSPPVARPPTPSEAIRLDKQWSYCASGTRWTRSSDRASASRRRRIPCAPRGARPRRRLRRRAPHPPRCRPRVSAP